MKAAMGESNRTIVTIVLIAVVLGAGTLIVTKMVNSTKNNKSILCAESGGTWNGTDCIGPSGNKCTTAYYSSLSDGENCTKANSQLIEFYSCSHIKNNRFVERVIAHSIKEADALRSQNYTCVGQGTSFVCTRTTYRPSLEKIDNLNANQAQTYMDIGWTCKVSSKYYTTQYSCRKMMCK